MNLDSINKWLTLVANLGVLVGIIFLSMEINQSNRIAARDGRIESVNQEYDLQRSYIEIPEFSELMVKLSDTNAELTPVERFKAQSFSQQLILRAANLRISYESGFVSEEPLRRQIDGIVLNIKRVPGIAPILSETLLTLGFSPSITPDLDPIFFAMWEEIQRHE